MHLDAQTTVLLSGASGGIGQAIARSFHRASARLIITGRRADVLAELARETGAQVIVCDLADRAAVERLGAEVGAVDVLVANAALPASGPLLDFSVNEIDRSLDVNVRAPIVMARLLAEGMVARGRGHIVLISSVAGMAAAAGTSLYAASKFALRGFSQAMRKDLRKSGVGVTTVFPGFIRDAGMFAETGVKLPPGVGTRSPEDVANAVLHALARNPAEIVVASPEQRLGSWLASLSPGLLSVAERLYDAGDLTRSVTDKQRHKR
jgi:short-subunit dehydrogenase